MKEVDDEENVFLSSFSVDGCPAGNNQINQVSPNNPGKAFLINFKDSSSSTLLNELKNHTQLSTSPVLYPGHDKSPHLVKSNSSGNVTEIDLGTENYSFGDKHINHDHDYTFPQEVQKNKGNIFLTINLTEYSKVIDVTSIRGVVLLLSGPPPQNSGKANTNTNDASGSGKSPILINENEDLNGPDIITENEEVNEPVGSVNDLLPLIGSINEKGEKEFKCPQCIKIYYSPRVLRNHFKREHDPAYKFRCRKCENVYKRRSILNNHIKNEHYMRCEFCKIKIETVKMYKTHLKENHTEVFYNLCKPYFCEVCDTEFTCKNVFLKHLREHGGILCNICAERFASSEEFKAHEEKHPKIYVCEICNKGFKEKCSLKVHGAVHNDPYSFFCQLCNKGFKTQSTLRHHIVRHSNVKRFMCDKCPGMFHNKGRLLRHQRIVHDKIKAHQCTDCDKKFSGKSNLLLHHRVMHLKLRPYQCEFCGRQFARTDALANHRYIHTGTPRKPSRKKNRKPSVKMPRSKRETDHNESVDCKICGKTIKDVKYLKKHLNTHARIRKFKCGFCGLLFLHQTSKIRHEKSHEADPEHKFVCPICWKRMKTKEELDLHIMEHNNRPKRHSCEVCGEAFCRRILLDNHILLEHTKEEEIIKKEEIIINGLMEIINT